MNGNTILSAGFNALSPGAGKVVALVRGTAFWSGILLPIVYLLLVIVAPATVTDFWTFGKLVTVNILALVVGHGYGGVNEFRDADRAEQPERNEQTEQLERNEQTDRAERPRKRAPPSDRNG